jgi:hypothetical protein
MHVRHVAPFRRSFLYMVALVLLLLAFCSEAGK